MTHIFSEQLKIQIIRVENLLSPVENQEIVDAVSNLIHEGKNNFIIDLSKLPYINSSGLSFLISILTRARSAGGEVVVCGFSENTKQLLLLTRLHNMFIVSADVEEAIEHFNLSKA